VKKNTIKAAAIVVCFAFLVLAFPGKTSAKARFDFDRFIKKPVMFMASLFSFLPIYDAGKYVAEYDTETVQTGNKIKVAGTLPSHRVGGGD